MEGTKDDSFVRVAESEEMEDLDLEVEERSGSPRPRPSRAPLEIAASRGPERPVPYVYVLTGIAALNSANLGFDIGIMSGAASYIQEAWGLNDTQVEVLIGILNGCAIGGAMVAHVIVDRVGRRGTFMSTCAVFIVGVLGMALSPNYATLLSCRVVTGVGVGMGLSIDPVYIAEVAPKNFRGELVTWSEISINIGILTGFVASYLFRNVAVDLAWRLMLGCGVFAPVLLLGLTVLVMPESPRWLVANGYEAEARAVLARLTWPWEDRAAIVADIRDAVATERCAVASWHTVFHPPTPALRRALLTGIGIATAQQVMAEESLLFYMPRILRDMGVANDHVFLALIAMGVLKTCAIVVSACFLDTLGRRPMLLLSVAGMAASLAAIAASFRLHSEWGIIAAIWTYMACFSLGIGPICWLMASEVFPLSVRAKGMALATVSNRIGSTVIAISFLSWAKAMPGRSKNGSFSSYFVFFTCVACAVWLVIYLFIPETKGKSLEEMQHVFEQLASTPRRGAAAPVDGASRIRADSRDDSRDAAESTENPILRCDAPTHPKSSQSPTGDGSADAKREAPPLPPPDSGGASPRSR